MNALELCDVTRRYRTGAGVEGLSLAVNGGEIVALVGLNGAGKTTLLRLALGMLVPDRGEVRISGQLVARTTAHVWRNVGHVIEAPLAYGELTGGENLRLASRLRGADPAVVGEAISTFKLGPYARRKVRHLSQGNRQRLGLAAALMHKPGIVVIDEPTNSLDPAGVIILRDQLVTRARDGAAVLVSSHHLDEVARIADRVVLMNGGRLIGDLNTSKPDLEQAFFSRIHADDIERGLAG